MHIDPATVTAIMGIAGIGVLGIIQALKKWLKIGGSLAFALAFGVSALATAVILVQAHAFMWLSFVVYTLVVFGEATGLYHLSGSETKSVI